MEQMNTLAVPEDELFNVYWRARKANFMLEDLMEEFFKHCDEIQDERGIAHICPEYGRACAKVEIAKDLLVEVDDTLRHMLEQGA